MKFFIFLLLGLISSKVAIAQWEVKNTNLEDYNHLLVIKFKNDSVGFAMGENSIIYKTTDGGENWKKDIIEEKLDIKDFQYLGDSIIYMTGDSKILESNDSGDSWFLFSEIPDVNLEEIFFFNDSIGIMSGYQGIYKTINKGSDWETKWTFPNETYEWGGINELTFLNDTVGFATGLGKRINDSSIDNFVLKTNDGGENWNILTVFGHQFSDLTSLQFINDSIGFIGNDIDEFYKTKSQGESWTLIEGLPFGITASYFLSEDIGYAAGAWLFSVTGHQAGFIANTKDGGNSWDTIITKGIPLFDIFFLNDSTGFTVGKHEMIMKTSNFGGEIIGDYPWDLSSSKKEKYEERKIQVFPNPFRKKLTIEFDDPPAKQYEIGIYTSDGKEILRKIYVDNNLIELDLKDIPDGIYFLCIQQRNNIRTIKIIKE
ncbi:MAG: T9SS type A sorting domain-containing protein [Bacteroidetes bacterium]|nr:T9SS type A sorting domain-containing protein [Bacteroidota bacterium]